MTTAIALYGIGLLWLAWEVHNAPVLPDMDDERLFDPGERSGDAAPFAHVPFRHEVRNAR